VHRDRCLELTGGALAPQHLLISASPGSGKSTLASQWAECVGNTAWVSLGPDDDSSGQMWGAVITSLQGLSPGLGASALPALLGGAATRNVVVRLIDDLAIYDGQIALVIDDLHLIEDRECHRELEFLLERAPGNVRVCLVSRRDPPIRFHRLVAIGKLAELRTGELGFDQAETYEFMADRLGLEIDEATAASLSRRVDGWPAGLYMAALSLRAGGAAEDLFAALDVGDRRVHDYIYAETLSRLDDETQQLLEALALLPRFCAGLCDYVLDRDDMYERIQELDASNLFVIALDRSGSWFRLHHMFAKVLADRAQTRDPERVLRLHRRAGEWHAREGDVGEAIAHFVQACEYETAADLIAASIPVQINVSRLAETLRRWVLLLPAELVERRASLCLARAWVGAINSRREATKRWLRLAMNAPAEPLPLPSGSASPAAEAALLQATFCFKDYAAGRRHSEDAVRLEAPDSPWQPLVQLMYAWYEYHAGRNDIALAAYERSEALATSDVHIASLVIAPALAALIHLERGELELADAATYRADAARRAHGVESVPQMLNSWFGTARAHRLRGRLAEASHDAETAAVVAADYPAENDSLLIAVPVTIELARIRHALGDRKGAAVALADARRRLEGAVDAGLITRWFQEAEAEQSAGGKRARAHQNGGAAEGELTARELTVLRMLTGNGTLREIGGELFVSPNTLKTHCRTIYRKLGVTSRADAVARARERGLIA
jgi:LuxR family maltose regulon positive regulatory protein